MPQDANSLDRLNDIVIPSDVSWWPLAAGWYVVIGLFLMIAFWLLWHVAKRWRANAYRRFALRELSGMNDAAAIAELLRRTALAVTPRSELACFSGNQWVDWLAAQGPVDVPPEIRQQLSRGIYQREMEPSEVSGLREFAAKWISRHQTHSAET